MQIISTPLDGLFIIKPSVFEDNRGYFYESYHKKTFKEYGISEEFVQDNQSLSNKGVLRGLHFQSPPFAQCKLVRVIKGAVLDVAVDIRKNSPTYGQYFSLELNEVNKSMLFIPVGFAHGFLTLSDNTVFFYKCSNYYNKPSEDAIRWNDPDLNIQWGIDNPIVSQKDQQASLFKIFNSPF